MCNFGGGGGGSSAAPIKNIIPQSAPLPEEAPQPVEIKKDKQSKVTRKRNPLRVDLASGGGGASTGVNV